MILVLSTPRDEHAQTVLVELSKIGAKAQLLDLREFPQRLGLTMRYEDGRRRFAFGCTNTVFDLDDCGAAWWRRPQSPDVSPQILGSSHRLFALNESVEALQ